MFQSPLPFQRGLLTIFLQSFSANTLLKENIALYWSSYCSETSVSELKRPNNEILGDNDDKGIFSSATSTELALNGKESVQKETGDRIIEETGLEFSQLQEDSTKV
ncbi:hypothetical protein NPIL_156271 [Nephila pilipes]|uniref:Uncharacterized protein n=1 Tax=Nephila pilipes TaxID=299642 RepID=A0A8X6UQ57_NEPPI|nr:hypothetical protein NPIL_156271 [Nephila pilipes]